MLGAAFLASSAPLATPVSVRSRQPCETSPMNSLGFLKDRSDGESGFCKDLRFFWKDLVFLWCFKVFENIWVFLGVFGGFGGGGNVLFLNYIF